MGPPTLHVLLRRDGWLVNPKRIYRLYKELGLQLRNKVPRRRVKAKLREGRTPATRSNETWAMDFVHWPAAGSVDGQLGVRTRAVRNRTLRANGT